VNYAEYKSMATVVNNEDKGNGAIVGIIIAVLALGLLVAYLLGAFPGTSPATDTGPAIIENNTTEIVPAPSQPSPAPSEPGQ